MVKWEYRTVRSSCLQRIELGSELQNWYSFLDIAFHFLIFKMKVLRLHWKRKREGTILEEAERL